MHVFLVVDIVLFLGAVFCDGRNRKKILYISVFVLLLLSGFHDGTGNLNAGGYDYPHYLDFFRGNGRSMYGSINDFAHYSLEYPYYYMCKLIRLFGGFDIVYILCCSFIFGFPFIYLVDKESPNPAMSIFLLFTCFDTFLYLFFLSLHRQMLAVSFMTVAYIIYKYYSEYKRKKYIVSVLLALALFSHSSSWFILPIFVSIFILWKRPVSFACSSIAIISSVIVGLVLYRYLNGYVLSLSLLLEGQESVSRSVGYVVNEIYDNVEVNLNTLVPMSLTTIAFVFFQNNEERESTFTKMLITGVCLYNMFSFLPLIKRGVLIFILFGIAGAIPRKISNNSTCKMTMTIIMLMFFYLAIKAYERPSFRLLPFNFIWE